ncbi:MAG: M15 family metallopeptidase [Synergistaceae bacterium]|nr:M15 family metallopeptidase [Synergistaceae bacterium]
MRKFMLVVAVLWLVFQASVFWGEDLGDFTISEIDADTFARIKGKSYKDNCPIPLEDLRHLHILHKDINGITHEGELVCNVHIASDVLDIFRALYEAGYPIERVRLVDEYDADDEASMRDNNSSCFNFRFISHTTRISKHGLGLAVDINTLYNPYIKTVDGKLTVEPSTAGNYTDRTRTFPYKIERGDLCFRLFTERGFEWGGDWKTVKDYQHFEVSDGRAKELYPDYR